MASDSLQHCTTVDSFVDFVGKLQAQIGKLGGRYFVTNVGKQSYNMNQIVYQFQKIVQEKRPKRLDILRGCESIRRLEESELFEALLSANNCVVAKIQRGMTKVRQVIGNFIFKITHNGFARRAVLNSLALGAIEQNLTPQEKLLSDKHQLITSKDAVEPTHFSWLLILGLLRIAEENVTDEKQVKQIRFLASNFLTKSAPIQL